MTSTISGDADTITSPTPEEILIDQTLNILQTIECDCRPNELEKMKSNLLKLRSGVTESAYQMRYFKSRETSLQQFIDAFPSMLGYWNRDLINIHSNQAYAHYFGKNPNEIQGRSMLDLLGENVFNLNFPYIQEVLLGKTQTFERDLTIPNGEVKSTLASYIPHFIGNSVVGFFAIVSDVSEKKRLEDRAKSLESAMYEYSRLSSLGQMASGIAHEINNPVTIIYSDACLLLRDIRDPDCKKDQLVKRVTEIQETALRIEKIIDGLRSVTKGGVTTGIEKNDLTEIIAQVVSICIARFRRSNLTIEWKSPGRPIFVLCNPVQISEILLNILNNAFDALTGVPHGFVKIEIEEVKDEYRVHLLNNGPIIKEEDRKKLFLPFFTTKGKSGTGLGLNISRDLAHSNGGSLFLAEKAETEFVLTLKQVK